MATGSARSCRPHRKEAKNNRNDPACRLRHAGRLGGSATSTRTGRHGRLPTIFVALFGFARLAMYDSAGLIPESTWPVINGTGEWAPVTTLTEDT